LVWKEDLLGSEDGSNSRPRTGGIAQRRQRQKLQWPVTRISSVWRSFVFSEEDAANKFEFGLGIFQETRSSWYEQIWSQRNKRGGAAWFHKPETSLLPEFFGLVRKELLPAPSCCCGVCYGQREAGMW